MTWPAPGFPDTWLGKDSIFIIFQEQHKELAYAEKCSHAVCQAASDAETLHLIA